MKRVRRKKQSNLLKNILIIVVPIFLFVGGYYIYDNYIKRPGIPSVNKLIDEKKKNGFPNEKPVEVDNYSNPLPGYRSEYGNQDIMGKLEIPGLNIDTLIVRASDNGYYLNYSLYRQWDGLGVPFFDYRNIDLNTNRQVNIYGHNTQKPEFYDRLPFTNLEAYVDEGMFQNYKDIYLSIDERKIHYEVVAIKIITDGNNEHMKLIFQNDADYLQHVNRLLSNTLYKSDNAYFTSDDHMLVLQVCHYNPMGSYLLVIGKEKK